MENDLASRKQEELMATQYHCRFCHERTDHTHSHELANGVPDTHIEGSEQFICRKCGMCTYKEDGDFGFDFMFDNTAWDDPEP
jgi:uncharacterized protein with PIN domain